MDEKPTYSGRKRNKRTALGFCARCGSSNIVSHPWFSVGAGVRDRPRSEDVFCQRCGYIGLPAMHAHSPTKNNP